MTSVSGQNLLAGYFSNVMKSIEVNVGFKDSWDVRVFTLPSL